MLMRLLIIRKNVYLINLISLKLERKYTNHLITIPVSMCSRLKNNSLSVIYVHLLLTPC